MNQTNQSEAKKGKLIAIEGVDASGKSTQLSLLTDWISKNHVDAAYFSFPRLQDTGFGEIITRFLRGEFGSVEEVSPFLLAAIFAADRLAARDSIREALYSHSVIILDRYVDSNVAFQCAKTEDPKAREQLKAWIYKTEFALNLLPQVDQTIYLKVSNEFVASVGENRKKENRKYLKGRTDIHEDSLSLQAKVAEVFEEIFLGNEKVTTIECMDRRGEIRPKTDISSEIVAIVSSILAP